MLCDITKLNKAKSTSSCLGRTLYSSYEFLFVPSQFSCPVTVCQKTSQLQSTFSSKKQCHFSTLQSAWWELPPFRFGALQQCPLTASASSGCRPRLSSYMHSSRLPVPRWHPQYAYGLTPADGRVPRCQATVLLGGVEGSQTSAHSGSTIRPSFLFIRTRSFCFWVNHVIEYRNNVQAKELTFWCDLQTRINKDATPSSIAYSVTS